MPLHILSLWSSSYTISGEKSRKISGEEEWRARWDGAVLSMTCPFVLFVSLISISVKLYLKRMCFDLRRTIVLSSI